MTSRDVVVSWAAGLALGLGAGAFLGYLSGWRRAGGRLHGVSPSKLAMAEFMIGRGVGYPVGTYFERRGRRCLTGVGVAGKVKGETIPFQVLQNEFLSAREAQVGAEAAGATLVPSYGVWKGGREPAVVGQVIWTGTGERTSKRFLGNMVRMCEDLACRLSQKEVITKLTMPGRSPVLLRCSPTGAPRP